MLKSKMTFHGLEDGHDKISPINQFADVPVALFHDNMQSKPKPKFKPKSKSIVHFHGIFRCSIKADIGHGQWT